MQKYNVAILGCGAIFSRHISAIQNNPKYYHLVGIYDPKATVQAKYVKELNTKGYHFEDEVYNDPLVNCVVILSPNNFHINQAINAIKHKKNVIMEKPATFTGSQLRMLEQLAVDNGVSIFGVLQVRLNPAVIIAKSAIEQGVLGKIRGVSLVQRWQRPLNYFDSWRGEMETGGGILREFGIHYLDAMQYLVGVPKVMSTSFFNTKFYHSNVHDTAYAMFDFGKFGGTMEVTIAAEPSNIECTLSIMSECGFLKLGGKSLDEIINSDFLDDSMSIKFNEIKTEVLSRQVIGLATQGSSLYHPELYRQIILNPQTFALGQMFNVTSLVENLYATSK